jgi:hypothetical protein
MEQDMSEIRRHLNDIERRQREQEITALRITTRAAAFGATGAVVMALLGWVGYATIERTVTTVVGTQAQQIAASEVDRRMPGITNERIREARTVQENLERTIALADRQARAVDRIEVRQTCVAGTNGAVARDPRIDVHVHAPGAENLPVGRIDPEYGHICFTYCPREQEILRAGCFAHQSSSLVALGHWTEQHEGFHRLACVFRSVEALSGSWQFTNPYFQSIATCGPRGAN